MRDKVIHVDFTKNRKNDKNRTFISVLKNLFKKLFYSPNNPSDPNNDKKIIYYNKDIS
ncbi:hypothetical protein I6U48_21100 [Clostridium sp. PL3]|uniref:Uncharacterized protein n=1 Tax=Clostridium thailandense TaxID=2794346 RepID=A0A949X5C2_9CLOT|nr:hypothetical protein [Clostridium thailandense]MBV7275403.1 hypothetical protein [Clostridium thailandense]